MPAPLAIVVTPGETSRVSSAVGDPHTAPVPALQQAAAAGELSHAGRATKSKSKHSSGRVHSVMSLRTSILTGLLCAVVCAVVMLWRGCRSGYEGQNPRLRLWSTRPVVTLSVSRRRSHSLPWQRRSRQAVLVGLSLRCRGKPR